MKMTDALTRWHQLVRSGDVSGLHSLLADNATFHSPLVHAPQQGKEITARYLAAAFHVFFNDTFKYVREFKNSDGAALEFKVVIDGVEVNGVDLISWNENGKIDDFKVMLRPMKAINLIREKMAAMLGA